jgi:hypothetical protein
VQNESAKENQKKERAMPEGEGWLAAAHYCQLLRAVPCVFCSKDRREQLDDARDLPPLLNDTPAPPSLSKKRMNWRLLLLMAAIFLAVLVSLFNILMPARARANGANVFPSPHPLLLLLFLLVS